MAPAALLANSKWPVRRSRPSSRTPRYVFSTSAVNASTARVVARTTRLVRGGSEVEHMGQLRLTVRELIGDLALELVPRRSCARQVRRVDREPRGRIGPQPRSRIRRNDHRLPVRVETNGAHVVDDHLVAATEQLAEQRALPCTRSSGEEDCAPVGRDTTGVQDEEAALVQQRAEARTQQIDVDVMRVWQPGPGRSGSRGHP